MSILESPQFANESERLVWDLLEKQKADDWVILPNLRLTNEQKDYELDLVVLMPALGIVVLEVKGGAVWVDASGTLAPGNSTGRG